MKMIAALAFVPLPDVEKVFESLCAILPPETCLLQDYFGDTYIGRFCRRGRHQRMLEQDLWNMYDRAYEELPRTNNAVERWHFFFFFFFLANAGCCHPNTRKFIKREQALQQVKRAQCAAGFDKEPAR